VKGRDIWGIPASSASSWVWKKVLKCRGLAHSHITGAGVQVIHRQYNRTTEDGQGCAGLIGSVFFCFQLLTGIGLLECKTLIF
ncbi:unnamed protein product, partial [Linum tenue]